MVKILVCKERLQINANCSDHLSYGVLKILSIQMDLHFSVVENLSKVVVAYEKKNFVCNESHKFLSVPLYALYLLYFIDNCCLILLPGFQCQNI